MGYRDKNGLVGQYRGQDVFVIGYKDLKPPKDGDETIYAVRCNNNKDLELVQGCRFIGTMTDSGHVEIYDMSRRRPYRFYKAPGLDEYEEKKKPVQTPTPVAEAIDYSKPLEVEFGYGEYSKVVDNFFKGLDKLWEEIDASIKS